MVIAVGLTCLLACIVDLVVVTGLPEAQSSFGGAAGGRLRRPVSIGSGFGSGAATVSGFGPGAATGSGFVPGAATGSEFAPGAVFGAGNQQGFGHSIRSPGHVNVNSFVHNFCSNWCRAPGDGSYYCCDQLGDCPSSPCSSFSPFQPPRLCSNDEHCADYEKCCSDDCVHHSVCKTKIGFERPSKAPSSGHATLKCTPRYTLHKRHSNCTTTSGAWKTQDTDGDGHVDSCDNCPRIANKDQADDDGDRIGNLCDSNMDKDEDGIPDEVDNCNNTYNQWQSDVDCDGIGDACDADADNDGILNEADKCPLVEGQDCGNDQDGDGIQDDRDICPNHPGIHSVDFEHFHPRSLDHTSGQDQPDYIPSPDGTSVTEKHNSKPGLMFGEHILEGVDYSGTLHVDKDHGDDDYIGFIFGYKNDKTFYVVMWKKGDQRYFEECEQLSYDERSYGDAGIILKRVHSTTGPSDCRLGDALWANTSITNQTSVLWRDHSHIGWEHGTDYHWELIRRPNTGLIRLKFFNEAGFLVDSGDIYDDTIKSGKLGIYSHSQAGSTWSHLKYQCSDDSVPRNWNTPFPSLF